MVTRTLSPRAGTVAVLFALILMHLAVRQLFPDSGRAFSDLLFNTLILCSMPAMSVYLNSRTGRKRIEHRIASHQDCQARAAAEFPIRINCKGGFDGARHAVVPRKVLLCCTIPGLVLSVAAFGFPAPLVGRHFLVATVGLGLLFLSYLIARTGKRNPICEMTLQGITAPDGVILGATVYVPWEDVAECEFIHDDEYPAHTYFRLRDRAGRVQFKWSFGWLHVVDAVDRARIHELLRSRFPLQVRDDADGESGALSIASKELWDQELDG
jgi:hypothetical protein